MSHTITTKTTQPIAASVNHLVELVGRGDVLGAFDTYYADTVSMSENSNPATVGKAENRAREEAFVGSIVEVHENRAAAVLVDEDQVAIHWILDFTNRDGVRLRFSQVALQTWQDGKIIAETFFYDSANLAQK